MFLKNAEVEVELWYIGMLCFLNSCNCSFLQRPQCCFLPMWWRICLPHVNTRFNRNIPLKTTPYT